MSKIFELKSKYAKLQANALNHAQKVDLSDGLKSIKKNELRSIDEHRTYIELLKLFRTSLIIDANLNGKNYLELLKNLLSVDVYSSPLRFLFELIQNVDDCEYADLSQAELDIQTDYNNGQIILTYNEVGFTPFNVFAITGIAEASKNTSSDKVEIGEKGIGFKSAFGVADKVRIQSGKFSFELYKNNFTIPEPHYDDNYEEIKGTRLTLFVEPRTVKQIYTMFISKYKDKEAILNQNPVLFLNKLTKLRVYFDNLRTLTFHVERNTAKSLNGLQIETDVHLSVDLFDCHGQFDQPTHQELICTRYTKPIIYNRQMCISRYGEQTTFSDRLLHMHIVLPHPENTYGDNAIKTGAFYSFLPTLIKLSVPMACHVPFKLDPPREYIDPQKKNEWFTHSYTEFTEMLKEVYIDYSQRVREDIINYLPYKNKFLIDSDVEKINCLKQDALKGETIMNLPIFCSVNNNFLPVDKIFMFQSNVEITEPVNTYKLLGEPRELFLPDTRAKNRNPGISTMSNVYELLFKRAIINGTNTDAILKLLSETKSFSFEKMVDSVCGKIFNISMLKIIAKYPKCLRAFQDNFIAQLTNQKQISYQSTIDESELQDVRFVEGGVTGLDSSDFNTNANAYFRKIQYHCYYLSGTPETFFFACDNILFLSNENRISALSEFCESIDKNCMLALNLRFKNASNQLNTITPNMEAGEYLLLLRAIRQTIKSALGNTPYKRYINLINDSGIDSERYIHELLQNADDCYYAEDVEPTFTLEITNGLKRIITTYNELGFTHENIRAITSIGESTKKQLLSPDGKIEIGEKGIGFKSVFAVASKVYIHSKNFRFALSDQEPTIPILPPDKTWHRNGTCMKFDLKEPIQKGFFTESKVLKLCLCLHTLKHIKLGDFDVHIFDDENVRKIQINEKSYEYKKLTHQFNIPDDLLFEEQEKQQHKIKSLQKIICYVSPEKENSNCYLYTGLPTRIKINIPLVIDAPFALTTSRDHLLKNNNWNNYIRAEVYNAIQYTIETLAKSEGISVLRFLHVKHEGKLYHLDIFSNDILNEFNFLKNIRKSPFLQTYQPDTYAAPEELSLVRIPDALAYCLENHLQINLSPLNIVKIKEKTIYEGQASALGLRFISLHNVLSSLSNVCDNIIIENTFRTHLYNYLLENTQELKKEQEILRDMKIIPVYGRNIEGDIQYMSWNEIGEILYIKQNCRISPAYCYILATHLMSKKLCEDIFQKNINESTIQVEKTMYSENLIDLLDEMSDKELYVHLLHEFKRNRNMLNGCIDILRSRINMIPLKNELGDIQRGKIYVSNESAGYFFGSVLPKHIAHLECKDFAIYINCKNITDVHYDDLIISDPLTEEDIEVFQDEYIRNGFEILEHCIRDGLIPDKYLHEVEHLKPDEVEYDENILNQPLNRIAFERHMRQILSNRIKIEKRPETRLVKYCVPKNGPAYLYDSNEARNEALHRYETDPKSGYCVCQMCKKANDIKYMEVNNVLKSPQFHWTGCGVSLCLMCSKRFEELRGNESVRKRFYNDIKRADVYVNEPIVLKIGTNDIVFGQKHLAEIQEILKIEEEIEN